MNVGVPVDPGDAAWYLLGAPALGRLPPGVAHVQRKDLAAMRRHPREQAGVRRAAQGGGGQRAAGRAGHCADASARAPEKRVPVAGCEEEAVVRPRRFERLAFRSGVTGWDRLKSTQIHSNQDYLTVCQSVTD